VPARASGGGGAGRSGYIGGMAAGSTVHRFEIALADVDRGVYADLDLRTARHPSETVPFLLARTLAYCLEHAEGIAFSHGLSTTDEPALWIKDAHGDVKVWIEVGMPAPERLHKASKSAGRVVVYAHRGVELALRQYEGQRIHKAEAIRIVALDPAFLAGLEGALERRARWEVSVHDGHLHVVTGTRSFSTELVEHRL